MYASEEWETGRKDREMVYVCWWEWKILCIFWRIKLRWILCCVAVIRNLDKHDGYTSFSGHEKLIIAYYNQNAHPKEINLCVLYLLRGGRTGILSGRISDTPKLGCSRCFSQWLVPGPAHLLTADWTRDDPIRFFFLAFRKGLWGSQWVKCISKLESNLKVYL